MGEKLFQVQKRALTLAQSGKFVSWLAITFELKFEPGYSEASDWLSRPAAKEVMELLCQRAREKHRGVEAA